MLACGADVDFFNLSGFAKRNRRGTRPAPLISQFRVIFWPIFCDFRRGRGCQLSTGWGDFGELGVEN